MYVPLPEEYVSQQFLIYAGYARRKPSGLYEGGCPICREGKSWGTKRRLFYIPKYDNIHCKNCHSSWNPRQWITQVSGKSYFEINDEAKDYEYIPIELLRGSDITQKVNMEPLPLDAINLSDKQQLKFYKNNKVVKECLAFIKKRRIDKAVNKPDNYYISLKDMVHKNRLCLPFTNDVGEIEFYQTRSFLKNPDDELPKYLGKCGGDKTLFGMDRISEDIDHIFIFEGPIDAMFVKNGVAIAGVDITSNQKTALLQYPFHTKIWVLDNQHVDKTALEVSKKLIDDGETVFIWPKITCVKDINDICVRKKLNELPTTFIVENSFSGIKAKFQLSKMGL